MHLRLIIFLFLFISARCVSAQIIISGTVYDIGKINFVEGVRVIGTNGSMVVTDSLGRYTITVDKNDTISFFYKGKPTQPFPVSAIKYKNQFDISIHEKVDSKYKLLSEVKVYGKTYREDSIENRETYKEVFGYQKPGIESTMSPSGVAGADLDEIINIFRFRRNKHLRSFQQRLENQEQEKFIDHRFSKNFVSRITGLINPELENFMTIYRPTYQFTRESNELVFNQYILNCLYEFKAKK